MEKTFGVNVFDGFITITGGTSTGTSITTTVYVTHEAMPGYELAGRAMAEVLVKHTSHVNEPPPGKKWSDIPDEHVIYLGNLGTKILARKSPNAVGGAN